MATSIAPIPKFQAVNAQGVPLSNGKLYTYVAGTSTPQATYTDSGGLTQNTNPVILDPNGRADVWLTQGTSYKFVLHNSLDVPVYTVDSLTGINDFLTLYAAFSSSTAPTGASLVGYKSNLSNATGTTVQARLQQMVSVKDFGATGDGVTDDTTAISNAILSGAGKEVWFPKGTYKITGTLTTADNARTTLCGEGRASIIKKFFNGTMISLGKECTMRDLALDGNGATYTGIGVSISTGALEATSWRNIRSCEIIDTASYGVHFTQDTAGYGSYIVDSRIVPYNDYTIPAIMMSVTAEANGNRHLINVNTMSNHLCDFGGCDNAQVVGCDGGLPLMGADSNKISFAGTRMVSVNALGLTFKGVAHTVTGCTINVTGNLTFDSTLQNFQFAGNAVGASTPIVDNAPGVSAGDNQIYYNPTAYTPTWTASSVNPTLGNGAITGRYWRKGSLVKVRITLVIGGTTNLGTGYWIFSLPKAAAAGNVGIGMARVGGSEFSGVTQSAFGAWSVGGLVCIQDAAATAMGAAVPGAWTAGDYLVWENEYEI